MYQWYLTDLKEDVVTTSNPLFTTMPGEQLLVFNHTEGTSRWVHTLWFWVTFPHERDSKLASLVVDTPTSKHKLTVNRDELTGKALETSYGGRAKLCFVVRHDDEKLVLESIYDPASSKFAMCDTVGRIG